MDAKLIVGGTPAPSFPNVDGTRIFEAPYPKRIAYEFRSGSYKLGWTVDFRLNNYQRAEVQRANPRVGDYLYVTVVPEEHVIRSILLKVSEADALAKGAQLVPMLLETNAKGELVETELLKGAKPLALDAVSTEWFELEKAHFVAPGTVVVLAYKVAALPTDEKVKLSDTQSIFSGCLEVGGFDIPTQM